MKDESKRRAAMSFEELLAEVRACTICEDALVDGVRPVLQVHPEARVLIAGQAPGRKVHESGVPFEDASGDRLRSWMGVSRETFYDSRKIAILPMGFCFPGTGKSGNLAPRLECAPAWRTELLEHMQEVKLTLVIGRYAQDYHLQAQKQTVTEIVKNWKQAWPKIVPLPHPSPRKNMWIRRNPWFSDELIPELQERVSKVLG
ncbi:MAG: uracil-DNA glycosylase [Planctomycetota bacterium]|jgi:uracil-DNA glycosylase